MSILPGAADKRGWSVGSDNRLETYETWYQCQGLKPALYYKSRLRSIFAVHTIYAAHTLFASCAIVVRPEGAATWQPRATPWGPERNNVGALKGRNSQGLDMPQSLSMNLVHLSYGTKHRDASVTPAIRSQLYAHQVGILQEWNSPAIVIGGAGDLVHALFVLSSNALCKSRHRLEFDER